MTLEEEIKDFNKHKYEHYFDELKMMILSQISYIHRNNKIESKNKIASEFYSYYYGNGKKFADYLLTLSFPEEDKKYINKIISFVQNKTENTIIPFIQICYSFYPKMAYFLSGDEYRHFVLYDTFLKIHGFNKISTYSKNIYCNDYDKEIFNLQNIFDGNLYDETGYGNRITKCCNEMLKIIKEIDLNKYDCPEATKKEFERNCLLNELTAEMFPEIKKYGKNRIY